MATARAVYDKWLASARPREPVMKGLASFAATATGADLARPDAPSKPTHGGYGEDRTVYTQKLFAPEGEEPRTLHLGLDIFAQPDTPVFAPLNARVHSVADNRNEGDYGPTVILEHTPAPGVTFHTLYGHLSRAAIRDLRAGQDFFQGEQVAALGRRTENGGWPSHLHFQIILDIGKARGDYPGVCRRSEADRWLAICPDPRPFLGLPTS